MPSVIGAVGVRRSRRQTSSIAFRLTTVTRNRRTEIMVGGPCRLSRQQGQPVPRPLNQAPSLQLSEAERNAMAFPALAWLDESLAALPGTTRKVLLFPPVHAVSIPAAGSYGEAREVECKARVTAIARHRGAMLVDWRFVSPLTAEDSHFWDGVHYRLPIAYRLIDDLAHIVSEGGEPPDGSYRVLVR